MKVKIINRSVYHKIAEVEVEVPDGMECNDIHEYILDNPGIYENEIDEAMNEAKYEFGFGLKNDAGLDEKDSESEWRFEYGDDRCGGHL